MVTKLGGNDKLSNRFQACGFYTKQSDSIQQPNRRFTIKQPIKTLLTAAVVTAALSGCICYGGVGSKQRQDCRY